MNKTLFRSSCPNRYLPVFAPTPREMRKRYASWSGRRRWSLSHMRTIAVSKSLSSTIAVPITLTHTRPPFLLFPSVLSSCDSRHMDGHFFHIRTVHGLVAEQLIRGPGLVTGTASLFRSSCTHHVLRRLVMHQPPFSFPPLVWL